MINDLDVFQSGIGEEVGSLSDSSKANHSPLTIEEIYDHPDIIGHRPANVTLSPDGTLVAYVWAEEESHQLWLIPTSGGTPQQLTRFKKGISGTPLWSQFAHIACG